MGSLIGKTSLTLVELLML